MTWKVVKMQSCHTINERIFDNFSLPSSKMVVLWTKTLRQSRKHGIYNEKQSDAESVIKKLLEEKPPLTSGHTNPSVVFTCPIWLPV